MIVAFVSFLFGETSVTVGEVGFELEAFIVSISS
jgi:hypothetical protein